jgi:integrase
VKPDIIPGSLIQSWNAKPITDFDKYAAEAAVSEAHKHGSDSKARKMNSVLNVLFNWLPLKYGVEVSPMLGMKKRLGLGPPVARDHKLENDEIVVFWKACDQIALFGPLFQTLLLTGCRLREVSGMTRAEFGDNGVWTIPSSRTKNHLEFLVPLPQQAINVINSVRLINGEAGLIFTTNGRTPVNGFSQAKRRLDKKMTEIAGKPIKPWRLHDLRRVFSTTMNESPEDDGLGIAPHIVEACLNHAKGGVAGVYNKSKYLSEKRVALQRWAIHLEGLVSGQQAKVVAMRGKKGK